MVITMAMWMLRIEPSFSARAAKALNCRAISPAQMHDPDWSQTCDSPSRQHILSARATTAGYNTIKPHHNAILMISTPVIESHATFNIFSNVLVYQWTKPKNYPCYSALPQSPLM